MVTIEDFKQVVAERLELAPERIYGRSLSLAGVLTMSPTATNSVDLVEAVAGAMAELDIDEVIDLPTITLDHTVDDLMDRVREQLEAHYASTARAS